MAKKKTEDEELNAYSIFFLTGEDSYSIDIKISEIVSSFLDSDLKDFNFSSFNEENFSAELISSSLYALPVMAEKRVVVVSDIDKAGSELHDTISGFLKKNVDSTILILTGTKPDKRKTFFKDILSNKRTLLLEFREKNEKEIFQWIKNYISSKGFSITSEALVLLSLSLSTSLNQASAEADKLIEYCSKKSITEDDVEKVLGISKEYNIFKLQSAVVSKNLKKSLFILDNILKNKNNRTDPIAVNLFLSRVFVSAFEIGYNALTKKITADKSALELGYNNPWKDADVLTCAKNFRVAELIKCIRYFLECDIKLKSSYQDPATAVVILLEKLIKHSGNRECEYLDYFGNLRRQSV